MLVVKPIQVYNQKQTGWRRWLIDKTTCSSNEPFKVAAVVRFLQQVSVVNYMWNQKLDIGSDQCSGVKAETQQKFQQRSLTFSVHKETQNSFFFTLRLQYLFSETVLQQTRSKQLQLKSSIYLVQLAIFNDFSHRKILQRIHKLSCTML